MTYEVQYRMHAYVCGQACVQKLDPMGTVPFSWVYQHRPPDCRYAVAGSWSTYDRAEIVIVWDLFNVHKTPEGKLITPEPVSQHKNVDAAIMSTVMLYEDDES